jgi:1-deoxy-D-xylulose-5-phosphate reductoisomerase
MGPPNNAAAAQPPRRLAVLGATGSIGVSTLEVAAALPGRFQVVGLSAHRHWPGLQQQMLAHRPRWAILGDPSVRPEDDEVPEGTELLLGEHHLPERVRGPEVDVVMNAIVGAAGLASSLAALEAGKTLALANKETLVLAGPVVMEQARRSGARLLPVDSEHSAIFQLLADRGTADVERIVLTASGGPFRGRTADQLRDVTVEEALRHPTWQMGKKITIDSATLMNKALEIIEARWLFNLRAEQIEVIIHPESIVHSFVEFRDGSVVAQLSPPDMKLPIQYALTYPERIPGPARRLNWSELRALTFLPPDHETFPALRLGFEAARLGGTAGAVLNAANEAAVARFLSGSLQFLDLVAAVRDVVAAHPFDPAPSLEKLLALDAWARQEVQRWQR